MHIANDILGLLRHDITTLFYHIIVEALESLLWLWYTYGIMCFDIIRMLYVFRLYEYV